MLNDPDHHQQHRRLRKKTRPRSYQGQTEPQPPRREPRRRLRPQLNEMNKLILLLTILTAGRVQAVTQMDVRWDEAEENIKLSGRCKESK